MDLKRQRFIAFSAGGFKQRLRGIEFGSKMIYNESNEGSESQFFGERIPHPLCKKAVNKIAFFVRHLSHVSNKKGGPVFRQPDQAQNTNPITGLEVPETPAVQLANLSAGTIDHRL